MLTKKEFMEGVHILQDNYHKNLTSEQLQLYYENLKDMNSGSFIKNIKENIRNNEFFPNIAQIRNEKTKQFTNYEQRDYTNMDFEQFYAN